MILGDFRPAGSLKEFYDELEIIKKNKSRVLVWQKVNSNKRTTYYGIMKSYLANKIKTSINLEIEDAIKFDKGSEIFIYVEELGLLFKGQYDSFVNNSLKIVAEDKVLLKEKRENQRMVFNYTKVLVDILLEGKIPFNNVKLKDITELGIGLICNEKLMKGLKKGMGVEITSINSVQLPQTISGEIVHRSKPSKHNRIASGHYQIGVLYQKPSKLIKKVMDTLSLEG